MKKFLALLLALTMLVAILTACAEPEDASGASSAESGEAVSEGSGSVDVSDEGSQKELVYDTTPRDIAFSVDFLPVSMNYEEQNLKNMLIYGNKTTCEPFVVESSDEAYALVERFDPYNEQTYYNDYISNLPDGFFDEKVLLINDCTQPCTGYTMAVRGVRVDENGVTVDFIYDQTEFGGDMVCPDLMIVTLDKSDVYGHESFKTTVSLTPFDTTERELDFETFDFIGTLDLPYNEISKNVPYPIKIMSVGALKRYAEESQSEEFIEFANGKTEEYFRDHALLVSYIESTNESNEFEIVGVFNYEKGTAIKMTRNLTREAGNPVNRIIVTEVDFSAVFGAQSVFHALSDGDWQQKQSGLAYFDGKPLEGVEVEMDILERETMIPVVATLKGMGASVSWSSDTKATISFKGYTYTLDLKKKIVRRAGEDRLWGSVEDRIALDKELMVTSDDMFGLLIIDLHFDFYCDLLTHEMQITTRKS